MLENTRIVTLVALLLLLQCLKSASTTSSSATLNLQIGQKQLVNFTRDQPLEVTINTTHAYSNYSSFLFQVHSEGLSLSLRNASASCTDRLECIANGTHVGLLQPLHVYLFSSKFVLSLTCAGEASGNGSSCPSGVQKALLAVVGITINSPIPGGCSLTSLLEIDAHLSLTNTSSAAKTVTFQDADIGYSPASRSSQPSCSDGMESSKLKYLQYKIYQKCVGSTDSSGIFNAIQDMLTPSSISGNFLLYPFETLSSSVKKKTLYYTLQRQGMVINVVAEDTRTGQASAYIPFASSKCEGDCNSAVSLWILGPLIGLAGLFLCFLAHRLFHAEVVLFSALISFYVAYFVISASTHWNSTDVAVATVALGLALTLFLFLLWFFTSSHLLFVLLFGIAMGFVLVSVVLYTPFSTLYVVRVAYVYALIILCGMLLFPLPLLFFPSILNIVASSLVGGYAVVFCIGLFLHSSLNETILRIVMNASVPGLLSVSGYCGLSTTDGILIFLWIVLCIAGIAVQGGTELYRRHAFKKRLADRREYSSYNFEAPKRKAYRPFPTVSLYQQLKRRLRRRPRVDKYSQDPPQVHPRKDGERRPLLSPNSVTEPRYT